MSLTECFPKELHVWLNSINSIVFTVQSLSMVLHLPQQLRKENGDNDDKFS